MKRYNRKRPTKEKKKVKNKINNIPSLTSKDKF